MTKTPIDIAQPLELEDGTPVTYDSPSTARAYSYVVKLPSGVRRTYKADGTGWSASYPRLRNVAVPAAVRWTGKKLQTRAGLPAEFVTVHGGKAIFKLSYPAPRWGSQAIGFVERNLDGTVNGLAAAYTPYGSPGIVRQDADDIIEVPVPRVTTYRNVYADGTVGETAHKSITAVMAAIKSSKVRVGILKQVHEGTELVAAVVVARHAERRDGSKPFPKA